MSLTTPFTEDNYTLTLSLPLVVDASLCRTFWEILQQVRLSPRQVYLDFEKTAVIRKSGYRLLRMLKDSLSEARAELVLIHCRQVWRKELPKWGFGQTVTLSNPDSLLILPTPRRDLVVRFSTSKKGKKSRASPADHLAGWGV
jgi:anti-anti-sigma regulatory factor